MPENMYDHGYLFCNIKRFYFARIQYKTFTYKLIPIYGVDYLKFDHQVIKVMSYGIS